MAVVGTEVPPSSILEVEVDISSVAGRAAAMFNPHQQRVWPRCSPGHIHCRRPRRLSAGVVARAATPAITALLTAHIPHEVLRYHHDPHIESFGDEAVDELAGVAGVDPEQIFKTLVVALPKNRMAVAVLPVPYQLSLKAA